MDHYNNTGQIIELLFREGIIDDAGLLKLQEAEKYISDHFVSGEGRST